MATGVTADSGARFRDWLATQGDGKVALALGVTRQAVYYWRTGRGKPKPALAAQLIMLAAGALVFTDIYPMPAPEPRSTR